MSNSSPNLSSPFPTQEIPLHLLQLSHARLNIALAALTFLVGLITLTLNLLLVAYYLRRARTAKLYDRLFLLLAIVDAATGLTALLQSITLVSAIESERGVLTVVMGMMYMLGAVAFHVSAFYNVLLAVCRTVSLVSPFMEFRLGWLYACALGYPVLWLVLAVYEVFSVYTNYPAPVDRINFLLLAPLCGSELIYNAAPNFPGAAYFIILLGIPYVLPSLVCLVCCVVALHTLQQGGGRVSVHSASIKDNRTRCHTRSRATVTILQLSAAFFVCNTIYFTTELTLQVVDPSLMEWESYLVYSTANILPLLNSVINPAILIKRGTQLRSFIRGMLNVSRRRISRNIPLEDRSRSNIV